MVSQLNRDSYFSIHHIIASEERVACKFENILPKLGFLCLDSETEDIEPGTKLEMPFWFAEVLHRKIRSGPIVKIDVPKVYNKDSQDILDADACYVKLKKWNRHYYELGLLLQQSGIDPECKISEFLNTVFKTRFKMLTNTSQLTGLDLNPALDNLSELENRIQERAKDAQVKLLKWLNCELRNIETSSVISNIRKRKQVDY